MFISEGMNLGFNNLVMYLMYYVLGVGIKKTLDLVSVNIYAELMMRIQHKTEVPVGAREAFIYLYKRYVGAIWHTLVATMVFMVMIVFGVLGEGVYKYLIVYIIYVLAAQLSQFLRIYIVSKT